MSMPISLPFDPPLPGSARYRLRLAVEPSDLRRAQRLRHLAFVEAGGAQPRPGRLDRDRFDPLCRHVLIEARADGALAGCFRVRAFAAGPALADSYAAQHYDLTALMARPGRLAELGRFCLHPGLASPAARSELLRLAWAALARLVDAWGTGFLFGCASFAGTDPAPYVAGFAQLHRAHLAPVAWRPQPRAAEVIRFPATEAPPPAGEVALLQRPAAQVLPPLLRSYLAMGGRVSDHAVRDRALNTLHVFVGLETAAVPAARARALRALAG